MSHSGADNVCYDGNGQSQQSKIGSRTLKRSRISSGVSLTRQLSSIMLEEHARFRCSLTSHWKQMFSPSSNRVLRCWS
jgi:predicted nucleotidyltransferase